MPRTTPCKDPYRSSLRTARTTRRTQQGGYSSATGTATKAASVCTTSKKLILGVSICLSLAINLIVHHRIGLPVIPTKTNTDESRMKYKKRIMPRPVRRPQRQGRVLLLSARAGCAPVGRGSVQVGVVDGSARGADHRGDGSSRQRSGNAEPGGEYGSRDPG